MKTGSVMSRDAAGAHALRSLLADMTPVFVLVDPLVGEPLPELHSSTAPDSADQAQSRREAVWQRPVARIELERTTLPPHLFPYVVELSGHDDPWLDATFEIAMAERDRALADGLDGKGEALHRIGGWLQSSMYPQQLAQNLAGVMRLRTELMYNPATYLRLADRRVLDLVRHVVGDERVAVQFGRLRRWSYLDARGCLTSLQSRGEEIRQLCLSATEWQQVQQGPAVACTLAQWQGEAQQRQQAGDSAAQTSFDQLTVERMYELALRAVQHAESAARRWKHRFTRPVDQTVWATLSLLHPEVLDSQAVQRCLASTGTPEDPPEPLRHLHAEIIERLRAESLLRRH